MNYKIISFSDTPFKRIYLKSKQDRAMIELRIQFFWEKYCSNGETI